MRTENNSGLVRYHSSGRPLRLQLLCQSFRGHILPDQFRHSWPFWLVKFQIAQGRFKLRRRLAAFRKMADFVLDAAALCFPCFECRRVVLPDGLCGFGLRVLIILYRLGDCLLYTSDAADE